MEAERQIAAARDAALESVRARGEFVASVSHELRTPMNGVLGATDLLEATGLNAEQQELLDTVRTSGDSLLAIINDILDFSKMEAGKMSLEAIELDLRQLVESTADVLAGRALQKHLELIVYIEPGTPTQLIGDPARVRQVLLNLLGNAIKFTKSGEIILRVHCEQADEAAATLRFSVQDTGLGIDPAARARLFRAFSQAEDSTARHFGGTGLGLTISRQLVELMGGVIDVESVPGKGSTFWFTAKFARGETFHDAPDRENPSLEGLRGTRSPDRRRQRHAARVGPGRLAAWQMVADTAEDAAHTLALMRAKVEAGTPYDVVLLDLNLGSIDGFTLAWAITNQPQLASSRLILVTSLGVESDRHACAQVGIRASVTKPLKYHTLLNTLAQVMGDAAPGPAAGTTAVPPETSRKRQPTESQNFSGAAGGRQRHQPQARPAPTHEPGLPRRRGRERPGSIGRAGHSHLRCRAARHAHARDGWLPGSVDDPPARDPARQAAANPHRPDRQHHRRRPGKVPVLRDGRFPSASRFVRMNSPRRWRVGCRILPRQFLPEEGKLGNHYRRSGSNRHSLAGTRF